MSIHLKQLVLIRILRAAVLREERTSTEILENSVANQYQDLENLGDELHDKQQEKSIDVVHGKKYSEAIKDKEKPETQESSENLKCESRKIFNSRGLR